MEAILEVFGQFIEQISAFFSTIAPGYLVIILVMFFSLLPYTIFKLIKKMVITHV